MDAAPIDFNFHLKEEMKFDINPMKTNMGVGAYRDDFGQPYILECVRQAEKRLIDNDVDHEYSGIDGI